MLSVLLALALQVLPNHPIVPPEGVYECVGNAPQGEYRMTLEVKKDGDTFYFVWQDKVIKAKGVGLRTDNFIAVVYQLDTGDVGVSHYKVVPGGLVGKWSAGDGEIYPELCSEKIGANV